MEPQLGRCDRHCIDASHCCSYDRHCIDKTPCCSFGDSTSTTTNTQITCVEQTINAIDDGAAADKKLSASTSSSSPVCAPAVNPNVVMPSLFPLNLANCGKGRFQRGLKGSLPPPTLAELKKLSEHWQLSTEGSAEHLIKNLLTPPRYSHVKRIITICTSRLIVPHLKRIVQTLAWAW